MILHPYHQNRPPPSEIARGLLVALRAANRYIVQQLTAEASAAFDEVRISGLKAATRVDVGAEEIFKNEFRLFGRGILRDFLLVGEESLPRFEVATFGAPVVLVDALDGTMNSLHLRMHFASTGTVFDPTAPPGERILANAIVLPGGRCYVDFLGSPSVLFLDGNKERNVRGPTGRSLIAGGVIAGVGQSGPHLQLLARAAERMSDAAAFYNIAGLPIVPRFLDVGVGTTGVDVILELGGQAPHDSMPLVCMTIKAGACAVSPEGEEISMPELEATLLRPGGAKLRYILAATVPLARDIVRRLADANIATV